MISQRQAATGGRTAGGPLSRAQIVAAARAWIGTPYHHQASVRGVGADCLGLLRGVWRDIYGYEVELPPAYARDWAEAGGREDLMAGAGRHLARIAPEHAEPGDVVVFRMRPDVPAKHVGLVASPTTFIHALEGARAAEVALAPWWRRRIAAAFSFPGVIE